MSHAPLLLFLHVAAVTIWVGGMFFAYVCLRPVAAMQLEPPARLRLWRGVFGGFFPLVWASVVVILVIILVGVVVVDFFIFVVFIRRWIVSISIWNTATFNTCSLFSSLALTFDGCLPDSLAAWRKDHNHLLAFGQWLPFEESHAIGNDRHQAPIETAVGEHHHLILLVKPIAPVNAGGCNQSKWCGVEHLKTIIVKVHAASGCSLQEIPTFGRM